MSDKQLEESKMMRHIKNEIKNEEWMDQLKKKDQEERDRQLAQKMEDEEHERVEAERLKLEEIDSQMALELQKQLNLPPPIPETPKQKEEREQAEYESFCITQFNYSPGHPIQDNMRNLRMPAKPTGWNPGDEVNDYDCPVCISEMDFSNLDALVYCSLGCGHPFHRECMTQWVKQKVFQQTDITCPACHVVWMLCDPGEAWCVKALEYPQFKLPLNMIGDATFDRNRDLFGRPQPIKR
jgi:Mg2+ and Co2+ transporter CorA